MGTVYSKTQTGGTHTQQNINTYFETFSLDEEDNVVSKNTDGTKMYQKDGVSPVDMRSFMVGLKEQELSKHLFNVVPGSGASGGADVGNKPDTPADRSKTSGNQDMRKGLPDYISKMNA